MRQPKYISGLAAFVFLCLGVVFLVFGFLSFAGIVKPSVHSSVQNPISMGSVFCLIGAALCVVQAVFRVINHRLDQLNSQLLTSGAKINGTVEKVYMQTFTRFGNKSPFRICYTYSYQGVVYHHKSCLLWDKPDLHEGDSIKVYANDFGKSTIQL